MPIVVNGTTLTDGEVGNTGVTQVYARNGITGTYILVFEKGGGGGTTMALFFGGNWKMNKLKADIDTFFSTFLSSLELNPQKKVVIFPPACYLDYVKSKIPSSYSSMIEIGAQFTASEEQGAYTGQISAAMAKDCGCTYALVGHSECREYLGVTNSDCNKAIQLALSNNLKVLYCVGDSLEQHEAGQMATVINTQLEEALGSYITAEDIKNNIIYAYEPIWAIGTGKTATPDDAEAASAAINAWIEEKISGSADEATILWAGSANQRNINSWLSPQLIDGVLSSGVATNASNFATMINTGTK